MSIEVGGVDIGSLQKAGLVPTTLRGAITYVAGTTGAIGSTTLFTVTGDVRITSLSAKCTTDLTSAGLPTWSLGVTGSTALFVMGMTDATGWDAGEWAQPATQDYGVGGGTTDFAWDVNNNCLQPSISANIIQTIATATITGGVVRWYVSYIPLSGDGAVALHSNLVAF